MPAITWRIRERWMTWVQDAFIALQFRVFVDFNNNGKPGADVYYDDFEFV